MDSDPAPAPLAAFGVLPNELKTRVLQLVAWQELAWRVRVEGLVGEAKTVEKAKHVDGLAAASRVSKEWRALAVPYLFDALTSERAHAPRFVHLILRRHSHLFSRARLEAMADPAAWKYTFSILPLLPRLRALELSCAAAKALFGDDLDFEREDEDEDDLDEEEELRISTLRDLAGQIVDLTLDDFNVEEAARILSFWPGVRRLTLRNLAPAAEGAFTQLVGTLQGKKDLLYLEALLLETELPSEEPAPAKWTSDAIASLRVAPPPLSSLHLTSYTHHPHDLEFISAFSPTLTHLHISLHRHQLADPVEPTEPDALPAHLNLPLLSTLSLNTRDIDHVSFTPALIAPFNASPILLLQICDEGTNLDEPDVDSPLQVIAGNFPLLRRLSFLTPTQFPLSAPEVSVLSEYSRTHGLPPPTQTPFDHNVASTIDNKSVETVCDGLVQVLDFGKLEVERVRAGGTLRDCGVLLEALRPLDARRRAWMD